MILLWIYLIGIIPAGILIALRYTYVTPPRLVTGAIGWPLIVLYLVIMVGYITVAYLIELVTFLLRQLGKLFP
jgi:hypothetical protein